MTRKDIKCYVGKKMQRMQSKQHGTVRLDGAEQMQNIFYGNKQFLWTWMKKTKQSVSSTVNELKNKKYEMN